MMNKEPPIAGSGAEYIQDMQYSMLDDESRAFQQSRTGSAMAVHTYQRGGSAMSSHAAVPRSAVKMGKGDNTTLVGINKAYQTGTTAVTSNPENFSVTQMGMNASAYHPQHQMFGSNSQSEILNYPYAYDQDLKHDVDFQEKLYRAAADEKKFLSDQRQLSLYPHGPEDF